jgi:hypothetical protein
MVFQHNSACPASRHCWRTGGTSGTGTRSVRTGRTSAHALPMATLHALVFIAVAMHGMYGRRGDQQSLHGPMPALFRQDLFLIRENLHLVRGDFRLVGYDLVQLLLIPQDRLLVCDNRRLVREKLVQGVLVRLDPFLILKNLCLVAQDRLLIGDNFIGHFQNPFKNGASGNTNGETCAFLIHVAV